MLAQRLNLMVKIVQVPQLMLLWQILWHKFSFFTLFLSNIVSYIDELYKYAAKSEHRKPNDSIFSVSIIIETAAVTNRRSDSFLGFDQ